MDSYIIHLWLGFRAERLRELSAINANLRKTQGQPGLHALYMRGRMRCLKHLRFAQVQLRNEAAYGMCQGA